MFKFSPTSSSFFHHIHLRKMRAINRFFSVFGRNFRPSISLSNHHDSHQQPLILSFLILTSIFFTRTTLSAIIVGDSSSDYPLMKNLSIINQTSSSSSSAFIHNNDKPNLERNQDRSHGHSTTTMFNDRTDENLANQDRSSIYSDQFVAQISGGPEHAQSLSAHHGFIYLGQIFDDYYHLMHKKVSKRCIDQFNSTSDIKAAFFQQHPSVISFNQEKLNHRTKRDFVVHHPNRFQSIPYFASNNLRASQENKLPLLPFPFDHNDYVQCGKRVKFDDPQWPRMWYLNRGNDLDMDVVEAWEKNYTGRGVVVTILDDGLEKDHPDLFTNYDPEASFDVNGFDNDPMPRYDIIDSNRHGTRCAGEVAANANNSVCAVGIAFNAKVGGIRMLDGDVTDAVEARSLGFNPQHIHIYSASWGPDDDGRTVDGPGKMAVRAFENGIRNGREGKGSIFVWASGNGGREKDNCNCDGYTNSIWTLSISSATEKGSIPWYSEACSATLASTYSSGSFGERQIVTTDLHHGCTSSHTGTSASAPLAAGICALALEANLNLTWRDMQHIVVLSATRKNLEGNWMENGAGLNVSHWFGYGLINASAMVDYSRNWITVPEQRKCIFHGKLNQSSKRKNSLVSVLNVSCNELKYMEHVQVVVNLTTPKRGDIEIEIISPSGTRSTLLTKRPKDSSPQGFNNWPFMTVHFWGESPNGLWTLMINNTGRQNNTVLAGWNIVMHGTKEYPFKDSYYPKRNRQDYIIGEEKPTTATNDLNHNQIDTNQPTNSNKKPINYFPSPNGRNLDDDHRDDEFNGNELEMNMHSPRQHSSSYASNKINKLLPHETYRTSMESSSSRLSLRIELYYFTLLLCTVLYSLIFF